MKKMKENRKLISNCFFFSVFVLDLKALTSISGYDWAKKYFINNEIVETFWDPLNRLIFEQHLDENGLFVFLFVLFVSFSLFLSFLSVLFLSFFPFISVFFFFFKNVAFAALATLKSTGTSYNILQGNVKLVERLLDRSKADLQTGSAVTEIEVLSNGKVGS